MTARPPLIFGGSAEGTETKVLEREALSIGSRKIISAQGGGRFTRPIAPRKYSIAKVRVAPETIQTPAFPRQHASELRAQQGADIPALKRAAVERSRRIRSVAERPERRKEGYSVDLASGDSHRGRDVVASFGRDQPMWSKAASWDTHRGGRPSPPPCGRSSRSERGDERPKFVRFACTCLNFPRIGRFPPSFGLTRSTLGGTRPKTWPSRATAT